MSVNNTFILLVNGEKKYFSLRSLSLLDHVVMVTIQLVIVIYKIVDYYKLSP